MIRCGGRGAHAGSRLSSHLACGVEGRNSWFRREEVEGEDFIKGKVTWEPARPGEAGRGCSAGHRSTSQERDLMGSKKRVYSGVNKGEGEGSKGDTSMRVGGERPAQKNGDGLVPSPEVPCRGPSRKEANNL